MANYRAVPRKVVVAPKVEPKPKVAELRKDDLVALAEERGLDTSGTKADLVERLA